MLQHGKVCKPYNSVLGEHFRSHWDVLPVQSPADPKQPPVFQMHVAPSDTGPILGVTSEAGSIKSGKSSKSNRSGVSVISKLGSNKSPSTAATSPQQGADVSINAQISNLSLADNASDERVRVVYMTEQVSHHPPVSAYFAACPARSLELTGIDQISAKVSGTTLRVAPGSFNKGIFINITGGHGEGERYHITHPVASVNGILRGSFYITVSDTTIITASGGTNGESLRTIIEYKEEVSLPLSISYCRTFNQKSPLQSWLGRAHFLIEGCIHTYKEGETDHNVWTKVKQVPQSRVVAVFDGSWKHKIKWRKTYNSSAPPSAATSKSDITTMDKDATLDEYATLLDLSTLQIIPKAVRSLDKQLPNESRKLWEDVTTRLINKEFGEATKYKLAIEQKQRDEAAERKKTGIESVIRFLVAVAL